MLIELNRDQIDYLLQLAYEDRNADWTIGEPSQANFVDGILTTLEAALETVP